MARRWLLTVLTGTALSLGFAGTASAQTSPGEPVTVDGEVAAITVTADASERALEAGLTTDAEVEEADTDVSPVVTANVTPDGPALDVDGAVEVAGEELPVPVVAEPVEEAAGGPAPSEQAAAGPEVTPAPAPAGPAPVSPARAGGDEAGTGTHSRTLSADGAAARSGMWADTYRSDDGDVPAPEVAPPAPEPALAAAVPSATTGLALPVIDTTPTVPGLLRVLAGVLVVGAAATWRMVRDELA